MRKIGKQVAFRCPDEDREWLSAYCQKEGRNPSEVLREAVRKLRRKTIKAESKALAGENDAF